MKPEEIRKIGALARLRLSDEEVSKIAGQFTGILGHLERLRAVPTEGVEPLDHPLPLVDVLREDTPHPGLLQGQALAGAPDAKDGQFRVPRVMAE
jgi:aspartyl-tRNA(Asn)/glutamyl-tRNA(Gln) amidotransferase subunit C